jgi:DNA-binding SARP family transcriptional activator/Flp pilus assembly protein TadD
MKIRLTTLGELRVECDGHDPDWFAGQRARAAFFIHLAVERRVSRAALATVFWPESDEARARQSVRQALHHLRKVFGQEWIESRAHELCVLDLVHVDTVDFVQALDRGDVESAARLYRGPFLAGVNLIDAKPWENWVDGRRALHGRLFRKACRAWVHERRTSCDLDGAIEAARHWVTPDPLEDEGQHQLIRLLIETGDRAGAIRQYETYSRLLESDGLRPLTETEQLMDQLRVNSSRSGSRSVAADAEPAEPRAEEAAAPEGAHVTPPAWRWDTSRSNALGNVVRTSSATAISQTRHLLLTACALVVLLGSAGLIGLSRVQPHRTPTEAGDEHAPAIVIADFAAPDSDPALGEAVVSALRNNLQGAGVRVLDAGQVSDVLQRMHAGDSVVLQPTLAREVALRHGANAVLAGSVARVGSGWVMSASLEAAATGRMIASFRETAHTPRDLIPAMDRLGRAVRRGAVESLQSVVAAAQLAPVTTSSLTALRIYADAERAFDRRDYARAADHLEEAVALDPEFAMGWRLLAAALANTQADRPRQLHAVQRAWELRHGLPPRERHLAAATYHLNITRNSHAAGDHYRSVLEIHPNDETALNNLALLLNRAGDFETAGLLLERTTARRPSAGQYLNLVRMRLAQGRLTDALTVAETLTARHSDALSAAEAQFAVRISLGDVEGARAAVEPLLDLARPARERAWAHDRLARLALWRGSLQDARAHFTSAEHVVDDARAGLNAFAWRISHAYAEAVLGDPSRVAELLVGTDAELLAAKQPPHGRYHDHQALVLAFAGLTHEAESTLQALDDDVSPDFRDLMRMRTAIARALLSLHHGDASGAVHELEAIRAAEACRYCGAAVMGQALLEAGRLRDAAIEWEHVLQGRDTFEDFGFTIVLQLWVMQRLPALYERLGEKQAALQHHQRLVTLWQHADDELLPIVQHAHERIRALESPARVSIFR